MFDSVRNRTGLLILKTLQLHPTNRNPNRSLDSEEDAFEGALNLSHNSIFNEQCSAEAERKASFGYRRLPYHDRTQHSSADQRICRGFLPLTGFPFRGQKSREPI